ncbi:MAG: hypothetical protein AAFO04_24100 [Cyanobacteria bacterium J06592_8]
MATFVDSNDVGGKTNLARITVYVEPEVKKRLEIIAKAKKRTISNFVSVLIDEALESESIDESEKDETGNNESGNSKPDDSEE